MLHHNQNFISCNHIGVNYQKRQDYNGATCLCVPILNFVFKDGRVTDYMPLYIQTPAITTYTGRVQTWCQRSPCRTNYKLSINFVTASNNFLGILVFQGVSLSYWLTLDNEDNVFLQNNSNHLPTDKAPHLGRI
jgi:hypothetical protein